ncbi:MAG: hypothetical protein NTV70_21300 [Acidobacteria bacterium]|nr:hypothetical protein [Acidobacteriota bacterium]
MWLATRYGWFSLACAYKNAQNPADGLDQDRMMIRARRRQHLSALQERFALEGKIQSSVTNDYRYRLIVSKAAAAAVAQQLVEEMTWSNFKNEAYRFQVEHKEPGGYVDGLHRVWEAMRRSL